MSNFLKAILKDRRVASFYPTPKKVTQKVLSKLSPEAKYFIEYGAGDGAFTREILKKLPADGKILAFETNANFIEQLKKINDSRLVLFPDDVRQMPSNLSGLGLPQVDVIISGIPFSQMSKKEKEGIVETSRRLLAENGVFAVYQNFPIIIFTLKRRFGKISWYFEPRYFLPLFVIFAKK